MVDGSSQNYYGISRATIFTDHPLCPDGVVVDGSSQNYYGISRATIFTDHPLCPDGEIGRRKGLKIPRWKHCAGSTPAPGTIFNKYTVLFFEYKLLLFCLLFDGAG